MLNRIGEYVIHFERLESQAAIIALEFRNKVIATTNFAHEIKDGVEYIRVQDAWSSRASLDIQHLKPEDTAQKLCALLIKYASEMHVEHILIPDKLKQSFGGYNRPNSPVHIH